MMTERLRIWNEPHKTNFEKSLGPAWYPFAESAMFRRLTKVYDQGLVVREPKMPSLIVGEHAFTAQRTVNEYSILLFTDSPTYLLPDYAIERADTLYVFDAEHYHRVCRDFEKREISCNRLKIIPSNYFPTTFEPIRRSKPLIGIVQPDYAPTDNNFAHVFYAISKFFMSPNGASFPADIAFYFYTQDYATAMWDFTQNIKTITPLPIRTLDETNGFTSLEETPNAVLFTDISNHFNPLQFMLNKNIKHHHATQLISKLPSTATDVVTEAILFGYVNHPEVKGSN